MTNLEWNKTFKKYEEVESQKISFTNRYGIEIVADMYYPRNTNDKLPALAVSGPFGAVKEQCSGLYGQEMAKRGFVSVVFDPSFTGESGGNPRNMASPDINTEDFQSAVDFLSNNEKVDQNKIGIIGICGWGGLALNTAAIDTRVKATLVSTMYDMSRLNANGYFDGENTEEHRYNKKLTLNNLRTREFRTKNYSRMGGCLEIPVDESIPLFIKEYSDYYKRKDRGCHERSLNSNQGWNSIGCMSFINQPILQYSNEVRSAVLMIHGDKAHSYYFAKDAYENMLKGNKYTENKIFLPIKGANHVDLYDGGNKDFIPFDKIEEFFKKYLS